MRRYACAAAGCGWQGLLPRHGHAATRGQHPAPKLRHHRWLVALVLLVMVGVGLAAFVVKALQH